MIARNALRLLATAGLGLGSLVTVGCYGDALDGHPIKHLGTYSEDAERARLNQEAASQASNQQAVPAGARLSEDQYRVGSPTNSPSVPVGAGGNAAVEGASNTSTVGNGTGGGGAADANDPTINRVNHGSMSGNTNGNTNTAAMPPENTAAGSVSTGSSQRTGGGATGGSGGGASGGSGGGATGGSGGGAAGGSGGGAAGGSAGKSSGGGR